MSIKTEASEGYVVVVVNKLMDLVREINGVDTKERDDG